VAHGRRRAFCIYSVHHRGTPARPGLVLGWRRGSGARRGLSGRGQGLGGRLCLSPRTRTADRDLFRGLGAGSSAKAAHASRPWSFCRTADHPQWPAISTWRRQARLIAGASGLSGRNVDYLRDLVAHLHDESVADRTMERLLIRVEALEAG